MTERAFEKGLILKKWKNRVPVCVVYPDSYYVGMSNLALHILYRKLNEVEEIVCERAFFEKDGEILSVETKKPLSSFEILFFTVSYELNYLNIIRMLSNSGIAVNSSDRKEGEPLVVGGGITLIANPEPICKAFDLVILGDVEATIPDFIDSYLKVRRESRRRVISELSNFSWVYNPSLMNVKYDENGRVSSFDPPDFKVKVKYFRGERLGHSAIISSETEFAEMYLIEGARGCPSKCRFCLLGNLYPYREDRSSLSQIPEENTKEIGIVGAGVSFVPGLLASIKHLKEKEKKIHLPSLRMDKISLKILELLKEDIKTLTFGLEAGSFTLRSALGKPITDEEIKERIENILELGNFNFKLYFMVGLPGEKREDVEAIFELTKKIRHVLIKKMAGQKALPKLKVHVSPFVPKPKTPLQWARMEDSVVLEEKLKWLEGKFRKLGGVIFTHESVKYSLLQAILARGDRRVFHAITRISSGENLRKVMQEGPINLGFYALRERERDEIFPWDFIDAGRKKESLYNQFKRYISLLNKSCE